MDLKSFREDKLKLTQAQFAQLLEVEQSQISRWENNPDSIRWDAIQKMLAKTGATFEELTGWKKPIPEALEMDNSWGIADFTKRTLEEYIEEALRRIGDDQSRAYIEELQKDVEMSLVKPKITIIGRSDTGKSTMINGLLGTDKIPTSFTPTTSIAVYIKHVEDRPDFIEEDVWIFADHQGDEVIWDEGRLKDEIYCRQWKIGGGSFDILRSFGTRQGEFYGKNAGSAVIFMEAPILRNCDIVDLPGFGTDSRSDDDIFQIDILLHRSY